MIDSIKKGLDWLLKEVKPIAILGWFLKGVVRVKL